MQCGREVGEYVGRRNRRKIMEKKIRWFNGTIDAVKAFPEEVAH